MEAEPSAWQLWASGWGDIASLAGLAVGLVGFAVTIIAVWRSKSAAEAAASAAKRTHDALVYVDAIADFAAAVGIMDEIKRLQREGAWRVLPERYSALRQHLIRIIAVEGTVATNDAGVIREAVGQFSDLEKRVENALARGATPANPAKLNEVVSAQVDRLQVVLIALQKQLRS